VLFHHHDLWCGRSSVEIPLDPYKNRTGDLWHIAVPGLHHDLLYGMSLHVTLRMCPVLLETAFTAVGLPSSEVSAVKLVCLPSINSCLHVYSS
jgi:hypothetical protein